MNNMRRAMQNVRGQIMPDSRAGVRRSVLTGLPIPDKKTPLEDLIAGGRLPAQTPTRLPPNILAGIGNIPGLNLDFSKLPKNIDLSNLDPRAINANPQGFQDMIERASAQEGLQGSLPVENADETKRSLCAAAISSGGRL